jgi:hypothetical protein
MAHDYVDGILRREVDLSIIIIIIIITLLYLVAWPQ